MNTKKKKKINSPKEMGPKKHFIKDKLGRVKEHIEKREPLYTVGGNVNWYSH